jgi:D-alanyl-D-alanine dipeptidase
MLAAFLIFFSMTQSSSALDSMHLPKGTRQVVLVQSESWESQTGELQRFARSNNKWVAVGESIPVMLGRTGLAWGRGLQQETRDGPQKKEGDGKAPAGVFELGTAFGYAPHAPDEIRLPYRQATSADFYVDDAESAKYNQWITLSPGSPPAWKSAESMKRDDGLYELGVVVRQNESPIVKGGGSAVFIHVWRGPGSSTAGCTSMAKRDLITLMRWLDPGRHPLLVQAPQSELNRIKVIGIHNGPGGRL